MRSLCHAELWQRLNEARQAAGGSWAVFLGDLLTEGSSGGLAS